MLCKKLAIVLVLVFLVFFVQNFVPADLLAANTSSKKGVGGEGDPDLTKLGVSWAYTWYICQTCFTNTGYEHVPMIWGRDYDSAVVTQVAGQHPGSSWLIWNEPNYHEQANLSPTEAAQLYRVLRPLIKNADPTAKLIVGGVLWLDTSWLGNFRNEYHRLYNEWPVVEGWHVHHYVGGTEYGVDKSVTPTVWRQRLEAVRTWMSNNGGPVELWLTEFGCLNSEPVAYQMMQDQTPWLETQPWLTRYAWYATWSAGEGCPNCTGALFETVAPYNLTRLGQYYASVGQPATPTPTPSLTPSPSLSCPRGTLGNLNCDLVGLINTLDLNILLWAWAPNGPVPFPSPGERSADVSGPNGNSDGKVNAFDLNQLLSNWQPN